MKKIALIILIYLLNIGVISAQTLKITWPIDRAVFQRNGNSNTSSAFVTIAGQIVCPSSFSNVKYRLISLDKAGNPIGTVTTTSPTWNSLTLSSRSTFFYQASVQTGWYRLEVTQWNSSNTSIILSSNIKFGVGDVYVIAGQSNARGEDGANAGSVPYDCVNAPNFNTFCPESITNFPSLSNMTTTTTIAPHGQSSWCYGKMANDLVDNYSNSTYTLPLAFFNVGNAGTTVDNWSASANGFNNQLYFNNNSSICSTENYGTDAIYHPYRSLREVLRYYGSIYGVRTILWHQGEFDNYYDSPSSKFNQTSQSNYTARLNNVISKSRIHFNSSLNWVIAKVSYMTWWNPNLSFGTNINVTNAQTSNATSGVLTTSNPRILSGPDSDIYTNATGDRNGGVHYNQQGLVNLGAAWKNSIVANNSNFTPITATTMTSLTIVKNSGTFTITAPGANAYRWVTYDMGWNNSFSTSNSVTISASSAPVRCYMRDNNGKWTLSESFTPSTCSTSRINSASELVEPTLNLYPNPSNVYTYAEISVPSEGNVSIDILDKEGKIIKKISESIHAQGIFKYSIESEYFNEGMYYLRANINGVSITKRLIKDEK